MVEIPDQLKANVAIAAVGLKGILRFAAARPKIGSLICNCTVREVHGGEFEISDSPIEDGSTLTDHIIELPRVLEIEAIFSPHPDNIIDQEIGKARDGFALIRNPLSYFRTVWSRIREMASKAETFQVITDLEVYDSMVFESYSHVEQNEGVIRLTATLRRIEFSTVRKEKFLTPEFADVGGTVTDVSLQGLAPL